ncbi:GNAT family N-acetyltransferase [Microbacterium sp. CH12i]|uniref:GNAT family N-acetyltransferase n=1 Tax=Microbacterium sp. CH12i TaxID=1479651 RepID=UPI000AED92C9|nr:GNAT family N-acetyltransferase [Microbacterium sp. CH12i]
MKEETTITEMVIPRTLDASDASEFTTMVDLGNMQAALDAGIDDLAEPPDALLPSWLDRTDRTHRGYVARRSGEIVGIASFAMANQAGTVTAETEITVLPANWGAGVEQALMDRVEQEARAQGARTLQTWTLHRAASSDRMLIPATGWGSVPMTALSELLLSNGFTMEQVERNSVLPLGDSLALAERMLADASVFAGEEYRPVSWTLPTPEHFQDGYAT